MSRTVIYRQEYSHYGCLGFLFDIVMCVFTGGLWLIWIFVREMRKRR